MTALCIIIILGWLALVAVVLRVLHEARRHDEEVRAGIRRSIKREADNAE
jgi:hypothetical protein